jgi:metallopeptidase MepB
VRENISVISGLSADGHSANVFAADMFENKFAKDHQSKEAWDSFRRGILEYGGSRNELQVLEEFLGRPANTTALLKSISYVD